LVGTVENHGRKMAENRANFCKNCMNHGKDMASNHVPEYHNTVNIYAQHDDHHYMQCKVFICKILSLRSIKNTNLYDDVTLTY